MARRTTRTTRSSGFSLNKFAFWLVIIIGIAMLAGAVCNWIGFEHSEAIFNWIKNICFILAVFIPVILSYRHARNKSTAWFILWIVFTAFIVVGLVGALVAMF